MNLLKMYDAAYPTKPDGYQVSAFYIGASGATPHVWTPEEIVTYTYPIKLPIYVPSYFHTGTLDAPSDFADCLAALKRVGAPQGTAVAIDFETLINSYYVNTINQLLMQEGYSVLLYGSTSTVFKNPRPFCGYWAATRPGNADYPGAGNLYPNSSATQYIDAGSYDENVILGTLPLWGASGNPPVVVNPPTNNWTENMIAALPTLKQGATGENVKTIQGCLSARGYATTIDGNFGPITDSNVRRFQVDRRVTNSVANGHGDGQVGQHTWTALVTNVIN
jgi:hypothetical protein